MWALRLEQNGAWTLYPNKAAIFANGDVLGARMRANGTGEIYNNGTLVTTVTLSAADRAFFNAKGGKIGIWTAAANVSNNPGFPPILYISGANTGGLRFVSLANPTSLTEVGFWTGTYSHDTYPHVFTDARANQCAPGHDPCEVVFSFAGTAGLKIIDVTDKSAPVTLSALTYSQLGYVHPGWISNDSNYIYRGE